LTSTQCINKKNEEQKESQYETHRQEATHNQDPSPPVHSRWKKKKTRGNNSETQSSTTFHKGEVFTKSTSSLTDFRAKYEQVHYIKRKEDYKGRLNLHHLSSRLHGRGWCGRGNTSAWQRHRRTCRRSRRGRRGSRRSRQRSDNRHDAWRILLCLLKET
jgi:hypothetical protein